MAAVRALIVAKSLLEEEIDRVYGIVGSWGYLRGRKLFPKSIPSRAGPRWDPAIFGLGTSLSAAFSCSSISQQFQ